MSRGCPREYLFRDYTRRAEKKDREFSLTAEQFIDIIKQDCHYCGEEPNKIIPRKSYTLIYNGIDRKDNNEGYTILNSLPCCTDCNFAKGGMSYEKFVDWLERSAKFRLKRALISRKGV